MTFPQTRHRHAPQTRLRQRLRRALTTYSRSVTLLADFHTILGPVTWCGADMLSRLFLAVSFILAPWATQTNGQCIPSATSPKTETFLTVKMVPGQGPSGSELYLDEKGSQVVAILRDYVGSPSPTETQLRGSLTESRSPGKAVTTCKVSLSGRGEKGEIEIEGEISPAYFQGIVTRHIGKDVFSHRISLKRRLPPNDNQVGSLQDWAWLPS